MNLFIINTNISANPRYEQEMIDEQKCAAYRDTKREIEKIDKGDKVLLYSNGKGIIARGIAEGKVKKKDDRGELDAEYYMEMVEFYDYIKPLSHKEINLIIKKSDPSFARPFNKTALKLSPSISQEVWNEVNKYV